MPRLPDQFRLKMSATPYWRKTVSVTLWLSLAWLLISLAPLLLAKMPSHWTFLGWPIAYGIVAFIVPMAYLLLIGLYAWRMARLERLSPDNDSESTAEVRD